MRELAARTTAPARWVAPVADGASWYPYRFMETPPVGDPHLGWALDAVDAAIGDAVDGGRPVEEIILLGFSQGACLAAEYALRAPRRFAGIALFTGGYLGPARREFTGDLTGVPVLLATSAEDEWVPLSRTEETRDAFDALCAGTTLLVEPGSEHAITDRAVRALDVLLTPGSRGGS
jgi:phospholipase/carboxylesterase